ncbi:MAG: molybdopterin oxidoreductase [Verrucomicrobiaceae bacterium]|nr:MAG: molybdopterin oxidoreductase [Verrucomicrobiaceae bacterium]
MSLRPPEPEIAAAPAANAEWTLIDQLLAEQRTLTAVERFSQWHEQGQHGGGRGQGTGDGYSHLMPAAPPGPGEQYRFEVNLDACTGCKACVSACHSLNGLDDDEAWRDVGSVIGGRRGEAWQQTVTTACHHCADPACASGCPVAAYEKEADTGIVRHLDDQCIGCQYCILKCPYDVPKYSKRLGIVRKCDMCVGRLREGEAPACVQACPTGAIAIRIVRIDAIRPESGSRLVPGAFDSAYTRPATLYRTTRPIPADARPADAGALRVEHAHWPLIWMLTLTQLSVGLFTALAVMALAGKPVPSTAVFTAAGLLMTGLAVSVLHLGRPLGAWRFFLGLRTSWMSREILAFNVLAGCATLASGVAFLGQDRFMPAVLGLTALIGLVSVFTSVMIYVDTRRPYWNAPVTTVRFFGTVLTLGTAGAAAVLGPDKSWLGTSMGLLTLLHGWMQARVRRAWEDDDSPWNASARVIRLRLRGIMDSGDALFLTALLCGFCALITNGMASTVWAALYFSTLLAGQVLDRMLFFTAAMGPRMTGGCRS